MALTTHRGDVHGKQEDDDEAQGPHGESGESDERILPADISVAVQEVDGQQQREGELHQ